MKRFIATMVAAMMLMATMATNVLAVDFTLTMGARDMNGVAVTELKKGDVVDVYATLNTTQTTAGILTAIKYDATIFQLEEDPLTAADASYLATYDTTTYEVTNKFVPYWFYTDYDAVTQAKYPFKDNAVIIDVPGTQPTDGGAVVNFIFAQTSAIGRNPATNLVVAAVRLKVVADVTADTETAITAWDATTSISGANAGELWYPTITPYTLTVKADAPSTFALTTAIDANVVADVTVDGEAYVAGTAYNAGAEVVVTAKPKAGYGITTATADGSMAFNAMGGEYTFDLAADTTITIAATAVAADAPATIAAVFAEPTIGLATAFAKAGNDTEEFGIKLTKWDGSAWADVVIPDGVCDAGTGPMFPATNPAHATSKYYGIRFHDLEAGTYQAAAYTGATIADPVTFVVE